MLTIFFSWLQRKPNTEQAEVSATRNGTLSQPTLSGLSSEPTPKIFNQLVQGQRETLAQREN